MRIGCAALLLRIAVQGSTLALTMGQPKPPPRPRAPQTRGGLAHLLFFAIIVIPPMSRLARILNWPMFLYWPGIMPNPHHAVLLAGRAYATAGFAGGTLPEQ